MCWFNCKSTQSKYKSVSLNVNVKGLNIATNGQPYSSASAKGYVQEPSAKNFMNVSECEVIFLKTTCGCMLNQYCFMLIESLFK